LPPTSNKMGVVPDEEKNSKTGGKTPKAERAKVARSAHSFRAPRVWVTVDRATVRCELINCRWRTRKKIDIFYQTRAGSRVVHDHEIYGHCGRPIVCGSEEFNRVTPNIVKGTPGGLFLLVWAFAEPVTSIRTRSRIKNPCEELLWQSFCVLLTFDF